MNQKNLIYLYYSTNKLESSSSEVSSLLGVMSNETNLVIIPKQETVKKREKRKRKCEDFSGKKSPTSSLVSSLQKSSLSPSHSPLSSKHSSLEKGRKQSLDKVKVFKESSLDEPFIPDTKLSPGYEKDNFVLNYEVLSKQKTTFEEVNTEVKKRYKSYDKEEEDIEDAVLYDTKPPKETCCEWLGRVISETRSPSALLSLSNLIQGVINEKMLQGLIDANSFMKMERMGLDKISLLQIRNNTFTIEFKDKEDLFAQTQIQTIQRFNCEAIIVSISLLVVVIASYFGLIYFI